MQCLVKKKLRGWEEENTLLIDLINNPKTEKKNHSALSGIIRSLRLGQKPNTRQEQKTE